MSIKRGDVHANPCPHVSSQSAPCGCGRAAWQVCLRPAGGGGVPSWVIITAFPINIISEHLTFLSETRLLLKKPQTSLEAGLVRTPCSNPIATFLPSSPSSGRAERTWVGSHACLSTLVVFIFYFCTGWVKGLRIYSELIRKGQSRKKGML